MDIPTSENIALKEIPMRRLTAFGFGTYGDSYLFAPSTLEETKTVLIFARAHSRKIVLRGNGRSYGDASLGSEHIALSLANQNRILNWDPNRGIIEVEGGVTLAEICEKALPQGWWPYTVSGTSRATVAGAISMDIHGKSQIKSGVFSEHVLQMTILNGIGEVIKIEPESEGWRDFIGGLGQLGIVLSAKIQLRKVDSQEMNRIRNVSKNWSELFSIFESNKKNCDAIVAWIDGFASGAGIVDIAQYATSGTKKLREGYTNKLMLNYGKIAVKFTKNDLLLKFGNRIKLILAKAEKGRIRAISLSDFNFQLDKIQQWESGYLPGALIQFQCCVPSEFAPDCFKDLLNRAQQSGFIPRLAVVKAHKPGKMILDYLLEGYSIALDFHVSSQRRAEFEVFYHQIARIVLNSRGKFYAAKDFLLSAEEFHESHSPEAFQRFQAAKTRFDPENIFFSQLSERLRLFQT